MKTAGLVELFFSRGEKFEKTVILDVREPTPRTAST